MVLFLPVPEETTSIGFTNGLAVVVTPKLGDLRCVDIESDKILAKKNRADLGGSEKGSDPKNEL